MADKPDPPSDVKFFQCGGRSATIMWTKPADNNSPITAYIIYRNTGKFDSDDRRTYDNTFKELDRIPGDQTRFSVELSPWKSYTFRVVAVNDLGNSEPSVPTQSECRIGPERPFKNPTGVCVESREPTTLTIVWKVRTVYI